MPDDAKQELLGDEMKFQKKMSTSSIMFASISAMVGSGWLFSSLYAAQVAGPAAIIAWVLAGAIIILIALTFAEVGCLFPIAGGLANYPYFTHGKLSGFIIGWISWISFVMLSPIEVQAALQYASNFFPELMDRSHGGHQLTHIGYLTATVFMLFLVTVNSIGIKFLSETNKLFSIWKMIVPAIAVTTYFLYAKDTSNLTNIQTGGFAPYGMHGVLSALAVAGVVFSFNGFQVAILMAAETKDPQKSIPKAVIGSVFFGTLLYGMLQLAFLVAIPKNLLTHGWQGLSFHGDAGPLAGLAGLLGASMVSSLLYVDAVVAPMGAGLVYVTSGSRVLYGLSANGYVSKKLSKINKRGIPMATLWVNFIIGMLAFLPFPGWQAMVTFLSSILVATYALVPICLVSLRKLQPQLNRTFQLPFSSTISFFAFYLCNLMLYWTGYKTMLKLFVCILVGVGFFLFTIYKSNNFRQELQFTIKHSGWLLLYFAGLTFISYFGSFDGGLNLYQNYSEYILLLIFSFGIFILSQKSNLEITSSSNNIEHILSENHTSSAEIQRHN